jgi:hypothetical protein
MNLHQTKSIAQIRLRRITPPKVHQMQSRAALQHLAIKQMHPTLAVANQVAAENLEADPKVDLDLAVAAAAAAVKLEADREVAAENLEADLEVEQELVRALEQDLVLDHHPQAESLLPPNLRAPLHRRRLALGKVDPRLRLLRPAAPNQLEHRSLQRREK